MNKTAVRIAAGRLPLVILAGLTFASCGQEQPAELEPASQAAPGTFNGVLADGANWIAEFPQDWNGTLLLYSHGYNRELQPPKSAPDNVRVALLEEGFALAASAYPTPEWALAEAVPSQVLVVDAFANQYRPPDRVIAWGSSMGGLVSSALAERHADLIDGALTMCASSMGTLPMMNMAFDGAFALTTLIPAEPPVAILGEGNNVEGAKRQMATVGEARKSPEGRARVALAGVLGGIPDWTRPESARPAQTDFAARESEIAAMLQWGIFLPRGDQERRAGGIFSWNTDVDYGALLEQSGRADFVRALYDTAGLDLEADLATLNAAPRVSADPAAIEYMRDNYTPTGKAGVPVLSMHTIGDGMTSPSLQQSYIKKVAGAAGDNMVAGLWIERAGHCTQSAAEILVALETLLERIESGAWHIDVGAMAGDDRRFIEYSAPPVPRAAIGAGD